MALLRTLLRELLSHPEPGPVDGYTIEDPCSASQWYIFDGSIIQGPTTAPLERYTTTLIGSVLSIRNRN